MKNGAKRSIAVILAVIMVVLLIPAGSISVSAVNVEGTAPSSVWDGTAATGFASGSGTEADLYIIMTAEQLKYFADQVNGGNTFEGKFIKLGADIVLNDTTNWESWDTTAPKNTWTAIGTDKKPFSGTFDGNGHTVSGIYVYTETDCQGLFGYAKNAAIKNLGIEKSYIKGGNYVGGVVGYNYYGRVINCYNTGAVSGNNCVGGVVGDSIGSVINCYNTGTVSGSGLVGGVVSWSQGPVFNCYNTGTVSGNDYVGGVVCENVNSRTINCYNTGTVSGSGDYVGGVAGSSTCGTVSNCYNTGTVSGSGFVGGVVGDSSRDTISNCYNTGTVSGSGFVGGLVGYNYEVTVSNCYNTGTVSGDSDVGGVVGYNRTESTVSNCYNVGTVSGNSDVGGVVGYSNGSVIDCYNTGAVSGSGYVGGVVGSNSGTVSNCYYLVGCAKDGNGTVQYGTGNATKGSTTADVSGQTTGLTDEQMKQKASFAGFDFDTVWTIGAIEGYDYPTLNPDETDTPASVWDGIVATGFASGSGTEADPYVILTAEQLKYFADQVNSGHMFDKFIKLGADIVLNDTTGWENWDTTAPKNTWTAIGNYPMCFYGTFDGDGHTVSGIYMCTTEERCLGLFGYTDYAKIKNLGIEKSYIKGGNYVGGVVGANSYSTVSDCYNTGTVSGDSDVGGVVGNNNSGTVINCYNVGTVSGDSDVGGVVGANSYSTVSDCYNTGTVNGTEEVGGVVGDIGGSGSMVSNCYNTGAVSGTEDVGGVVGCNKYGSTVSNCYNTGTVNGDYYVGGVVGCNDSKVSNCYYLAGCATDGNGTVQYGIGSEATGKTTADVSGKTTGLTDAQMKQKASFAGFDFDTVWTIGVVEGYDYPTLQWQKDMGTTDPDEPTQHNYVTHEAKAPTCTESGWAEYVTCDHCGYTTFRYIPALGHSYESEVAKEATCTETGIIRYTCTRCKDSYDVTTYSEHNYVHTVIEPTCTETGLKQQKCSVCSEVIGEETIPATGHHFGDWTVENGVLKRTCSCGETETKNIDKKAEELPPSEDGIKVNIDGSGSLPEGTAVKTDDLMDDLSDKEKDEITNAVKVIVSNDNGIELVSIYDISLEFDGAKIQPDGTVKVELPIPAETDEKFDTYKVVYIDDNGAAHEMPTEVKDGKIVFTTDHFSKYAVVGIMNTDAPVGPTTNKSIIPYVVAGSVVLLAAVVLVIILSKKRKRA